MDRRCDSGKAPRTRDAQEAHILRQATARFAETGYEGSALADIAARCGISKQNLLYYFPSKQILYERVLDSVLDQWLERMDILAGPGQDPAQLVRAYIRAKLRFSREQPQASRVFALEIISGAAVYGSSIRSKVLPILQKDIAIFEDWIAAGKIAAVNPTHLLFAIWAMTQSYADFAAQMALVLGQEALTRDDFAEAETLIVDMVLARLRVSGA